MPSELPIASRFLFRMEIPCLYMANLEEMNELPAECEFPNFEGLERRTKPQEATSSVRVVRAKSVQSKSSAPQSFRVRGAWNENGLAIQFFVEGKNHPLWCSRNRPEESDRVELWVDTRNLRNVHRANRYCHRFVCLPSGAGVLGDEAFVTLFPINRARQFPNEIPNGSIRARSQPVEKGYKLFIHFASRALTGYDPREFQDISLAWMLADRDLGVRLLTAGAPLPFQEDPSLWYTFHLTREQESNDHKGATSDEIGA
ncbi:MAG: hypothetical protein Q4D38_08620 [Planctomycetia bacterium]|nr:hypothetical protein [Planctomycetia bacterium]